MKSRGRQEVYIGLGGCELRLLSTGRRCRLFRQLYYREGNQYRFEASRNDGISTHQGRDGLVGLGEQPGERAASVSD